MTDILSEDAFVTEPAGRRWWYDGGYFYVKNNDGEWVTLDKTTFRLYLVSNPHRTYRGYKLESESLCEADAEVLDTCVNGRVSYAGPLAGWKEGIRFFEGTRALVTRSPNLMVPKAGEFPVLKAFLEQVLRSHGDQMTAFMGWLSHALQALYEGRPRNGLALILAGEAGCGKTLLKEFVRLCFGGAEVYPYSYMLGKDNFNRELTESPLWVVDDEAADTRMDARIKFGAEIKKVVANTAMRCRGMHKDGLTLAPFRRLCICVNTEPDRLMVLPPIDDDIADKLLLLHCIHPEPWPMPMGTFQQKAAFFEAVQAELPAFIHHTLAFDLPEEWHGRFGCRHWHAPEVVESLLQISPEMQLAEQIDRVLTRKNLFQFQMEWWEGSVLELKQHMQADDSGLMAYEKQRIGNADAYIGRRLAKLSGRFPGRYERKKTASKNVWRIHKMEATS